MPIPDNVIANADDLGMTPSVNLAILNCFQNQYINSASLLTNTDYFDDTVDLIHENKSIYNIGVHVNFADGKPVTNFREYSWLNEDRSWNLSKTNRKLAILSTEAKTAFSNEIAAQIDKALSSKVNINHLDSHYHLHTQPNFYTLFVNAAKHYKLKLRLAQTYNQGNQLKFLYRKYLNRQIKLNHCNYSDYFENIDYFLKFREQKDLISTTEIMIHPDLDAKGALVDHYDPEPLIRWKSFLESTK